MNLVGNKKSVSFIEKSLKSGQGTHAYLFSGPENLGKFHLAKAFARALITGEGLDFQSGAEKGFQTDLFVIAPENRDEISKSGKKDIQIERIRQAKKEMSLFPLGGRKKVLIIDDAHKMNSSSQNALLKMLEEPNSTSVIILVTHEESKILPTIKSRCQKVFFSLVSGETASPLKSLSGEEFFNKYWIMSMGRPGIFLSILKDNETLAKVNEAKDYFERMSELDLNRRFSRAEEMSKDSPEAIFQLSLWMWLLRQACLNGEDEAAQGYYSKIEMIQEAVSQIGDTNSNNRLILENLLINI